MKNAIFTTVLIFLFTSKIQSQGLYDLDTLRSIYINFENSDWNTTLIDNWYAENGERELATLEMDGVIYDSVAIRYKGNATFFLADQTDNPKIPLNIDMNDFVSGQKLLGFKKIKLSNSLFDPTVLRDVLGFQIYGNYMPSPEANWMKVYIEGDYIGVYPNTEAINKQFLTKHFDYKNGVLFKCDPASQFGSTTSWESSDLGWYGADSSLYYGRYGLKSDYGWAELLNLMDILNNAPDDLPTVLNIDRVLWYLAVSTVIANYDSYNGFYMHNYYLYLHENGLFQILPWDVGEAFLCSMPDNGVVVGDAMYEWDIFNQNDPFSENRPLVDFVANHPKYRKQYLAHIRTIVEEVMNESELLITCQSMQAIIADAHADDGNAFFGLGNTYFESNLTADMSAWGLEVAGIIPTVEKRKAYLLNHPEISLSPPVITQVNRNPEFPQTGEQVAVTAFIENASNVDLMITTNKYASHFEAFPMMDGGMHEDGLAGDGIYGAFIPFSDFGGKVKYYIRAENTDAMMLHPQRAEYEFHEYEVEQTNAINNADNYSQSISVFPNPFSDELNIHLDGENEQKSKTLKIYTSTGVLVKNETIQFSINEYSLSVSDLKSGIYFLELENVGIQKIVKF